MMFMRGLLFLLFLIGYNYFSFAAEKDTIIVSKDLRLDSLTAKQAEINRNSTKITKGYRLQVITTRKREDAFQVKAELLKRFPDQKTYTIYQSPYFKVRFGNFIDREEAEKYKKILSGIYSQGVYVVSDMIEYSPREEDLTE